MLRLSGSVVVLLLFLEVIVVDAFRWILTDTIPGNEILTFSERYMFGNRKGPILLPNGAAYITISGKVSTFMTKAENHTVDLVYTIFNAADGHYHDSLSGMCSKTSGEGVTAPGKNPWASNVLAMRNPTQYYGPVKLQDEVLGLNDTFYRWDAVMESRYTVKEEGWHNVAFQVCSYTGAMPVAKMDGLVTFRNPYGFLPAELFGFLPFEAGRCIAFLLVGFIFVVLFLLHRESAIPLHYAILAVFGVAVCESALWFLAYEHINRTGSPYCCPFPPLVVAALVVQVFRQTFSRTLLLIVALGYGVVRPKMMPQEWTAVFLVSILYFVAAAISQVSEIVLVNDIHSNAPSGVVVYQIPELIMDVIFLSWIYLALTSTIRILTEFKQSHKLSMYRWLTGTIYVFVFFFSIVTVVAMLNKLGYAQWPWKWAWVQQILWEVLNFCVITCVCAICRPADNSQLLAYASQLPTEDPDDDDDGHFGIEADTGMYADDDRVDGIEMHSRYKQHGEYELPEENDYGLDEDV